MDGTSVIDHLLRVYLDPSELNKDGYPFPWSRGTTSGAGSEHDPIHSYRPIKDIVREQAGHRCVRCGHPYRKGEHGNGEWSPCDERCDHRGPIRIRIDAGDEWIEHPDDEWWAPHAGESAALEIADAIEAQWRILTVHHLNGIKHDCRWWNLAALCQRCHLTIQGRVRMERVWPWEHSDWFKPYVAGYYASVYLGEELTRPEVDERLDELLALEQVA